VPLIPQTALPPPGPASPTLLPPPLLVSSELELPHATTIPVVAMSAVSQALEPNEGSIAIRRL
jgi:hypothetical protein